jgi:hypothetical protein
MKKRKEKQTKRKKWGRKLMAAQLRTTKGFHLLIVIEQTNAIKNVRGHKFFHHPETNPL